MKNIVLEKYNKGEKTAGAFTHMRSMAAVEALGNTGLDYVIIDMEHCPTGIDEASKYITAADAAGIVPFVRVPGVSRKDLLHVLDTGAMGVIVPCIENMNQIKELVEYTKFRPEGKRGYCMTRDGKWGYSDAYTEGMNGYMKDSNRECLIIPQCETTGCLELVEEIVATDGIGGIMVGPYDLSIGLGMPGDFENPVFIEAIEKVQKAAAKAGKPSFIFAGDAKTGRIRAQQGFDSVIMGIDLMFMIDAYRKTVEEFKKI